MAAMPGRSVARRVSIGLLLVMPLPDAGVPAVSAQATAATPAAGGSEVRLVAVWPPGPLEVAAAFDRSIDPAVAKSLIGRTIRSVETQAALPGQTPAPKPSAALRIVAARLVDDRRTLILATDPHPRVARYFLPLGGEAAVRQEAGPPGRLGGSLALPAAGRDPGSKSLDGTMVAYDLTGVEAAWGEGNDPAGEPKWSGWWPHLDVDMTRRLTRGSKPHETGLALLARPGRLVLSALVRLPPGNLAVRIETTGPIEEALLGDARAETEAAAEAVAAARGPQDKVHRAGLTVESQGTPLFLTITARTPGDDRPFSLKASYRLAGQTTDHPIERDRLLVPWAPVMTDSAIAAPLTVPDLAGGDPARGQAIFSGDQARCAQCHAFRGQGGQVGPDLTEIGRKSRVEIYRDLAAPSAAIEADYTSYTVATKPGQVYAGVVRAEGADAIRVTDTNAHATIVRRGEIQEIRPSATSIMPPGLAAALGDAAVRDLIAFLTSTQSPQPPAKP
jgi:putative heme-binding domain-containing protein